MPTLEFETIVAAPLESVWRFYQHVTVSLPALTSPAEGVVVESAQQPMGQGSQIVMTMNGPFGRVRWVARIVEHRPPHAVVFGEEARFVDEQESGPFKLWRHEHDFERVDEKTTRITDRVSYRLPYGPIGWVGDWLFVRRRIVGTFRYRGQALRDRWSASS
jgi:ligand-binding SRPBCC domain-containing protein